VLPSQEEDPAGRGVVTTYREPYDWEAIAAAAAASENEPPLSQEVADLIAAILAPTRDGTAAA
jgi:hypothetical protein